MRLLVFDNRHSEVEYGDRIRVAGEISIPEVFETDTGRVFDYRKSLLADRISHIMLARETELLEKGEGSAILSYLYSIKHRLIAGINDVLPEPESALLLGLLLGEKQSLGEDITSAMRNAGVVHIIVLSGYNVSLVIQAVTHVAFYVFPRAYAFIIAAVFVVGFAFMAGLSETTLRATLMALLMMLATVLNRPKAALNGLLFAASAMALVNPYVVLYDLSFQLSVLATLGLILFTKTIAIRLSFITDWLKLREIVATTIATQITVLPLLIYSIGAVSLVFIPANIFILPVVPSAMLVGFVAAIAGMFSYALAFPIATVAYAILTYIISASVFFGELPLSAYVVPEKYIGHALLTLIVFYALVITFFKRTALLRLFHSNS